MARRIAYIGFGTLGVQIASLIRQSGDVIAEEIFFDDILFNAGHKNSFPFETYNDEKYNGHEFFVCLGYKHLAAKNKIISRLLSLKRKLGSFIHASCIINPTARIEPGCVLYQGCNIDQGVTIKSGSLLNNGVIVSHDSIIENSCFLAPGVVVCGNASIGPQTFIGAGSVISNNIRVGSDVIAGPSTSITIEIPDGHSAIGNPVKILAKRLTLL